MSKFGLKQFLRDRANDFFNLTVVPFCEFFNIPLGLDKATREALSKDEPCNNDELELRFLWIFTKNRFYSRKEIIEASELTNPSRRLASLVRRGLLDERSVKFGLVSDVESKKKMLAVCASFGGLQMRGRRLGGRLDPMMRFRVADIRKI